MGRRGLAVFLIENFNVIADANYGWERAPLEFKYLNNTNYCKYFAIGKKNYKKISKNIFLNNQNII